MSWEQLAEKAIEQLQAYDKVHHTDYSYFFLNNHNQVSKEAVKILASALEQANKGLTWQKVQDSQVS